VNYSPYTWHDGVSGATPITSARLNALEQGLSSALLVGPTATGVAATDTAAINSFIAANPGRIIILQGAYGIKADLGSGSDHGGGIVLNQARTVLMCYGATFTMTVTTQSHYQMVDITAADCGIYGGKWIGDVGAHAGSTGEWGHGIVLAGGSDRSKVQDTYVAKCWGDGYLIWEDPADVSLVNCIADDNRRQGLSIIDATRPRVMGGLFKNTGSTAFVAPGGGISIEPDAATSRDVVDAVITGVTCTGNKGPGVYVSANGRTATGEVIGCRSVGGSDASWGYGFRAIGSTGFRFTSCRAEGATLDGFASDTSSTETVFQSCEAKGNTRYGFLLTGTRELLLGCASSSNGQDGISIQATATDAHVIGGTTNGNSQTTTATYQNVDNYGAGTRVIAHSTSAGGGAKVANYGVVNRTGATSTTIAALVSTGSFGSGSLIDQAGTIQGPPMTAPTGTTAPSAGGAGALPATPTGYMTVKINGTDRKVAYY
jgi:hypothetical protein